MGRVAPNGSGIGAVHPDGLRSWTVKGCQVPNRDAWH